MARQDNLADGLLKTSDTRGFADLVAQLRNSSISMPVNLLQAGGVTT